MPKIMTREAEDIAKKLNRDEPEQPGREKFDIQIEDGRKHRLVKVHYNGRHIGQYGIQRASRPQNHNYIAEQLYLSRKDAYELAKCPLSVDDYIDILVEKGQA